MINSEKELEDYICSNQEEFIKTLKTIYTKDKDIKFLGRQVRIGNNNIADLIYYAKEEVSEAPFDILDIIIVELKYRKLEPKDLAQISRYMSVLNEKIQSDEKYYGYETNIYGVFVSFGENEEMQEISINFDFDNIDFIEIKNNITFEKENWTHSEQYIDSLILDNRLEQIYRNSDN